ncbi:DUF3253 domain-containing protein [Sneathiella chinensis]|uniref:DUF3253 domain-containing protein n=1 Tax=Sneathiella chinensis TaxID=349750 RepID=A0ABQ5U5K7_9PROT|nr:DUF3253 domain-containing protein [Sneathiella chinensis]GLQ07148.1 hypothetical protein GCM10007924_23690 [Sneathiella chinensis]
MDADKTPSDIAAEEKELPDDPVVTYILNAVAEGGEISPNAVAQAIAADRAKANTPKDAWRKYMTAVRQQAIHLARKGRLEIVRKGEVADPNDFKGLYKLRLPRK